MEKKYILTLGVAALAGVALGLALRHKGGDDATQEPANLGAPAWEVSQSIDEAAAYLVHNDNDKGRFNYMVNAEGKVLSPNKYNIVRHAGAIYALADYQVQGASADGKKQAADAAARSAQLLVSKYVKPIKDHPDTTAAFSDPKEEGGHEHRLNAKLGASGLGLIGLMGRYRAVGDAGANAGTDLTSAEGIGRFITFMEKDDGAFYSNYTDEAGPSNAVESLYYPGEAILGLVMLYEGDHDPKWLDAAARGVAHLVQVRKGQPKAKLPPDHWIMIATDRLYQVFGDLKSPPVSRDDMVQHVIDLANNMIDGQDKVKKPAIAGCYTHDGRTTPSSTRLEGMLALEHLLGSEPTRAKDRQRVRESIVKGILFLRRAQVTTGPTKGAWPAAVPIPGEDGGVSSDDSDESNEPGDHRSDVRIDFVQHAMSAMMRYEKMCAADPSACPKK